MLQCEYFCFVFATGIVAERLIGTIRREFLDHTLFWNAVDLERKLGFFEHYYNRSRTRASLDGKTPAEMSGDRVNPLRCTITSGKSIVAVYFNSRSPLD